MTPESLPEYLAKRAAQVTDDPAQLPVQAFDSPETLYLTREVHRALREDRRDP